jgi:hypothetical protein
VSLFAIRAGQELDSDQVLTVALDVIHSRRAGSTAASPHQATPGRDLEVDRLGAASASPTSRRRKRAKSASSLASVGWGRAANAAGAATDTGARAV